jgi:hypothetical protein
VPNCMYTAHDIVQSPKTFRFKKTGRNRASITAPTDNCQERILRKFSDPPAQPRQWNVHTSLQMVLIPFLGRANMQNDRALGAIQGCKEISSSQLSDL